MQTDSVRGGVAGCMRGGCEGWAVKAAKMAHGARRCGCARASCAGSGEARRGDAIHNFDRQERGDADRLPPQPEVLGFALQSRAGASASGSAFFDTTFFDTHTTQLHNNPGLTRVHHVPVHFHMADATKRAAFTVRPTAKRPRPGPTDAAFAAAVDEEDVDEGEERAAAQAKTAGLLLDDRALSKERQLDGGVLAEAGRWNAALACFDEACRRDPTSATAHEQRAQCLLQLEDRVYEAVEAAHAACAADPAWGEGHLTLSRAQLRFGEPGLALASAQQALTLGVDSADEARADVEHLEGILLALRSTAASDATSSREEARARAGLAGDEAAPAPPAAEADTVGAIEDTDSEVPSDIAAAAAAAAATAASGPEAGGADEEEEDEEEDEDDEDDAEEDDEVAGEMAEEEEEVPEGDEEAAGMTCEAGDAPVEIPPARWLPAGTRLAPAARVHMVMGLTVVLNAVPGLPPLAESSVLCRSCKPPTDTDTPVEAEADAAPTAADVPTADGTSTTAVAAAAPSSTDAPPAAAEPAGDDSADALASIMADAPDGAAGLVVGEVVEVFGPVDLPHYSLRFVHESQLTSAGLHKGTLLYALLDESEFLTTTAIASEKAYDHAGDEEEVFYSDDEEEADAWGKHADAQLPTSSQLPPPPQAYPPQAYPPQAHTPQYAHHPPPSHHPPYHPSAWPPHPPPGAPPYAAAPPPAWPPPPHVPYGYRPPPPAVPPPHPHPPPAQPQPPGTWRW